MTGIVNPAIGWVVIGLSTMAGLVLIFFGIRVANKQREINIETDNYANKLITDSKYPEVLEITDTLQQMANIEAITTSNILYRKRRPKLTVS